MYENTTSKSVFAFCFGTACRLQLDKEESWKQEMTKWCSALKAYTEEYNHWLCLKVFLEIQAASAETFKSIAQ